MEIFLNSVILGSEIACKRQIVFVKHSHMCQSFVNFHLSQVQLQIPLHHLSSLTSITYLKKDGHIEHV